MMVFCYVSHLLSFRSAERVDVTRRADTPSSEPKKLELLYVIYDNAHLHIYIICGSVSSSAVDLTNLGLF